MGEDAVAGAAPGTTKHRINGFFTEAQYERIREVCRRKGISESGAVRYLTEKGIDWWDRLTSQERETA